MPVFFGLGIYMFNQGYLSSLVVLAVAFTAVLSWFVCAFIVRTQAWHGRFTLDQTFGKQKVHATPTPRIGGAGVYLALLLAYLIKCAISAFKHVDLPSFDLLGLILMAAAPAFLAGFVEDLTKKVSVAKRLAATAASGLLLVLFTGHWVTHVSVPLVNDILAFWPIGVLFTAFAVAGIANSVNIIDGFNGLAGGVVVLMLLTLGAIAFKAGDIAVMRLAFMGAAATLGFLLVNFPRGRIFLGDAGAYGLGFYVAAVAVLLSERNPGHVSPWAMLLVCAYPVIETLFSIYRRSLRKKRRNPGQPDALHLHSLVYRKLVSRVLFPALPAWQRNAYTAVIMWVYAAIPMLGALFWPHSFAMVALWFMVSGLLYLRFYKHMLRWSLPRNRSLA